MQLLDAWLAARNLNGHHPRYRLRLWRETGPISPDLLAELRLYAAEAHEDARRRLRRGFDDGLSPYTTRPADPAAHYPARLHHTTLQGYFGELLAGIAIEHWGALDHTDWLIPAFLFRFHDQEFQHLELIYQRLRDAEPHDADATAEQRPGRTGDDVLAFRINANAEITDVIVLEAKCLSTNRNATITQAHAQLSAAGPLPSGVRELVNLLADYDTPQAAFWLESLMRFRLHGYTTSGRHDGLSYATRPPVRPPREVWLPPDRPHDAYTADRYLEGLEFHFDNLDTIIPTLYRNEGHGDA